MARKPIDASLSMQSWELSACDLAERIRRREISATEAARAALDRTAAVNPRLNAIIETRPEETLAAARRCDERLAAGEDVGPLGGVPVTTKDITDQAGYATANGVRSRRDCVAERNSPVVDNLLGAGGLMLGRTNVPAFSYRWFTNNLLHGATRNPHDARLTPGGSSGGGAAAVASGMGQLTLGTDIAGSVRYPAYACGIHGLRPSTGRVPQYNATMVERPIGAQLMAVTGPLARTVADLRLALAVISAGSPLDPAWVPAPLEGPPVARRAALCLRPDGLATAPEIVAHLEQAAAHLADAGWIVEEIPELPPLREAVAAQLVLWLGDRYEQQLAAAEAEGDPGALAVLRGHAELGRAMTMTTLSDALVRRATLMRQWLVFLAEHPVVLMPVSAELPFRDDLDLEGEAAWRQVWEAQLPQIAIPLLGLPALSLCTGRSGTTPVGVQIVAGRFREDLCLAAGEEIERRGYRPAVVTPAP